MITPRPYQTRVVDAIANALAKHSRVLAVAPTGAGKSLIIAMLVKRYLEKHPTHRVLCLVHTSEILSQNEGKLHEFGISKTGIYCAGLGRKEASAQVVLASRDSLGRNPGVCGYFHMCIVDEAHALSDVEDSMYQRIFEAISPLYSCGLTATPWRSDNGLIYGKNKFWKVLADRIGMEEIRDAGFLVPYVLPPRIPTLIDTSNVKVTAGEFNNRQLSAVSMTDEVVAACLNEWWIHASERTTSLFFCCSRAHAAVVVRQLSRYTGSVAYLDGTTSAKDREALLAATKRGAYKAVVNVGTLTTGVDLPVVDCIVLLRATQSVSLFAQMVGRGLRLHPNKTECLVIDTAGNFDRFGPLESPRPPKAKGTEGNADAVAALLAQEGVEMIPGEAPQKTCPACEEKTAAATTVCEYCGHVFFNHADSAITDGDLAASGILRLAAVFSNEAVTKKGVPCLVVEYRTECGQDFKEWLFHKTPGFTKWQAEQKLAALARGATHIRVDSTREYPRVYPLNLTSSGSFSLISLLRGSSSGGRTTAASGTRVQAPTVTPTA